MVHLTSLIRSCDPPKSKEGVELSIIIPCRAESWTVLSMTLQSIQEEAIAATEHLGSKAWECIVVFNGDEIETSVTENTFNASHYRVYGNFRSAHTNANGSCIARSAGIYNAVGRYVYIGDSHIIIGRDMFKHLMDTHCKLVASRVPVGILHSALGWLGGVHSKDLCDHYTPKIAEKFWGNYSKSGISEPHIICMKGTSFLMLRDFARSIGLWNNHFKAYGGGEPYINLKTWRMGYEVWVEPKAYVWHLAQQRGYCWDNSDLWFNTLLAAYTIGGDNWLNKMFNKYIKTLEERHSNTILITYVSALIIMRDTVRDVGKDDMEFINNHSKYTLDELMSIYGWE